MQLIGSSLLSRLNSSAPETVSSWAFKEISRRIIVGELAPEMRVTEEWLVKELGASRTPLRDALRQLEELGLIVRQRNRTIRIAPLQTKEVIELVKVREHLEGLVAREVATRVQSGEVTTDHLWKIVREMEDAEKRPANTMVILELGVEFHAELHALSGLKKVERILFGVQLGLARYRSVNAADPRRLTERSVEHRLVVEAIESGDADRAEQQMRAHIRHGLKAYATNVRQRLPDATVREL